MKLYLQQKEQNEMEKRIRKELQKRAEEYRFTLEEKDLIQACRQLGYQGITDLLSDLDMKKISYARVLHTMHPEVKSSLYQRTLNLFHRWTDKPKTAPILGLKAEDKFTLATCCHPVVGEAIVAIRQKKNSYVIHKRACSTLGKYKKYPDKWVAVEWNLSENNNNMKPARLRIVWKTGPSTMGEVLNLLGREKASVSHMNTLAQNDKATEVMADIQVRDQRHLNKILNILEQQSKIISVDKETGQ